MGQAWYKDYLDTVLPSTGAYIMLDKLDLSSISRIVLDRLGTSSIRTRASSISSKRARLSSIASIGRSYIYIKSKLDAFNSSYLTLLVITIYYLSN